jgi:hypothetical protein
MFYVRVNTITRKSMQNTVNNTKIENLLNKAYSQIDLKEGIFNYIQQHVLESYSVLKGDMLKTQSGDMENILLKDIEKKHQIESILYRDLPELIDVYSKLPLEYRNEHKLKSGQTHRELLLDNLQILGGSLKKIIQSSYESVDQQMSAKNRFFKEKYEVKSNFIALNGILEKEIEIESIKDNDTFNWKEIKSALPKNNTKLVNHEDSFVKNNQVKLHEEVIEYKVKSKFLPFMSGTYDSYVKATSVFSKIKQSYKNAINSADSSLWSVLPVVVMTGACIVGMYVMISAAGELAEIQKNSGEDLLSSVYYAKRVNENSDLKPVKDVHIAVLNEWSKDHNIKVSYKEDMIELTQKESNQECRKSISAFSNSKIEEYEINGQAVKSKNIVAAYMPHVICNKEVNIVKIKNKL